MSVKTETMPGIQSNGFEKRTNALDAIGLRDFTPSEIGDAYARLKKSIHIGITRAEAGLPFEAGYAPTVASPIEPITREQLRQVPPRTRVIAGSYGGSTWLTDLAEMTSEGRVTSENIQNGSTPEKREDTMESFVGRIGHHITRGLDKARDVSDLRAIGLSAGFSHRNTLSSSGVEAQIHEQPSNWKITDLNPTIPPERQPYLGEELLRFLAYNGAPQFENIYFQNDTQAVGHDMKDDAPSGEITLGVGFVFGTGSNASLGRFNTQASSSLGIFPKDNVYQEMVHRGYVPDKDQMKLRIGGERIAFRVAAGMHLLAAEGRMSHDVAEAIVEMMRTQGKGLVVSQIASCDLSYLDLVEKLNEINGSTLSLDQYALIKKGSQSALRQAGQAIGVMVASVVSEAGYTNGRALVPVEGSVFWKGHEVKKMVEETVGFLLPENELSYHEAQGLSGVAKLAMVGSHTPSGNIIFQRNAQNY